MTKLTIAELAAESVELLPERETLTTVFDVDANVTSIRALNSAMALNLGGAGSSANAWAAQAIFVGNVNF